MTNLLKSHLHPLGSKIIFWNIVLLVLVKVVLPYSAFQHATILENIIPINSREIITTTNQVRILNGLPELKPNFQLDTAAAEKLNDMLSGGYFAHISPSGVTPWFWIKKSQYTYSVAGENLAVGFFTAQDTVQAWMNSPSHKANLLNSQYQDIGIAVGKGTVKGISGIIVVQMFGKQSFSSVQSKPILLPQPTKIVSPATASQNVVSLVEPGLINSPQVKSQLASQLDLAILPQAVSTDTEIPLVAKPVILNYKKTEQVNQLLSTANIVYMLYSFAFALLSIVAFFIFGRHQHLAIKSSVHAAIFLFSVVITATNFHISGIIF